MIGSRGQGVRRRAKGRRQPHGQQYVDVDGRFDRVASIEMFEAVGERYWPSYFGKIGETLVPGGRAASVHRAVDDDALASRGLRGTNVGSFPDRALLEELGALAAAGDLRVPITGRYTLDEAVTGLADAQRKHSRGKLVIEMSGAGDQHL